MNKTKDKTQANFPMVRMSRFHSSPARPRYSPALRWLFIVASIADIAWLFWNPDVACMVVSIALCVAGTALGTLGYFGSEGEETWM